jgi:hypothetical protein
MNLRWVLPVTLIWLSGCASHFCHERKVAPAVVVQESATVTIAGLVRNPGQYELNDASDSLAQAIAIAGGARGDSVNNNLPRNLVPKKLLVAFDEVEAQTKELEGLILELTQAPQDERVSDPTDKKLLNSSKQFQSKIDVLKTVIDEEFSTSESGKEFVKNAAKLLDDAKRSVNNNRDETSGVRGLVSKNSEEKRQKLLKPLQVFLEDLLRLRARVEVEATSVPMSQSLESFESDARPLLVSLRRRGAPATYFYSYNFVTIGLAGQISLKDGDYLEVLPASQSSLLRPVPQNGDEILLDGIVQSPGLRDISKLQSLRSVVTDTKNQINSDVWPQLVVNLKRRSPSRVTWDVFVIPVAESSEFPFDEVVTVPQDMYTFTLDFNSPLINESLIGRAVAESLATSVTRIEKRVPRETHQLKKQRWISQHTEHLRSLF